MHPITFHLTIFYNIKNTSQNLPEGGALKHYTRYILE